MRGRVFFCPIEEQRLGTGGIPFPSQRICRGQIASKELIVFFDFVALDRWQVNFLELIKCLIQISLPDEVFCSRQLLRFPIEHNACNFVGWEILIGSANFDNHFIASAFNNRSFYRSSPFEREHPILLSDGTG